MSVRKLDRLYLRAATRLAELGLYSVTRHNPRVGCLIVKNGQVLGRGYHRRPGCAHAEVEALQAAGAAAEEATVYSTLEPCCIHGQTPPCTDALIRAKVQRVVSSRLDSNPRVRGKGLAALRAADIKVECLDGSVEDDLNVGFHRRMRIGRPFVRLKVGMSFDGRLGLASGESRWITGPVARADVMHWRGRSGAIISGIGTILADDPQFTVRDPKIAESQPLRVVLDTQARLPSNAELFNHHGEVIIVCHRQAHPPSGATAWAHDQQKADLDDVHRRLANEGVNEVLVEAGPTLLSSYLESGLWDEMLVYLAPKLLGASSLPLTTMKIELLDQCLSGRFKSVEKFGEDLRITVIPTSKNEPTG